MPMAFIFAVPPRGTYLNKSLLIEKERERKRDRKFQICKYSTIIGKKEKKGTITTRRITFRQKISKNQIISIFLF